MIEAVLALVLVAVSHLLRVRFGWNLADEGFLWNGALRIGQGKIPILDYKSYDPGRFYWSWAGMRLFGTGLMGLRHSVALFQVLGLWAGLSLLGTQTGNVLALALAGTVLVLWMQPRHKIFDHAMSLIAVLAVSTLIQAPSPMTALLAGMATGFAGVMGRNHVVYTFAASVLALLLLQLKAGLDTTGTLAAVWGLGIVIGYSPMLAMFTFIPGMFRHYVHDKVLVFFRRGGIDISCPIPWPWTQDYTGQSRLNRLSRIVSDLHFVAVPAFYLIMLSWILVDPGGLDNGYLVGSCLVGVTYMHHAASRSDVPHLCQIMQPFQIALFVLAYGAGNPVVFWLIPPVLIVIAWLVTRQVDAALQWVETPEHFSKIDILGEQFLVPQASADIISRIRDHITANLHPDDRLFIAPMAALLYPLLQKETPVRSDFLHFPETGPVQKAIIADLEKTGTNWALIEDSALDGRDELRFCKTHAIVWHYLETHFTRLELPYLDDKWSLWQRNARHTSDDPAQQRQAGQPVTTKASAAST